MKPRITLAAGVVAAATLLGAVATAPQPVQARSFVTEYDRCMIDAQVACYPWEAGGQRPPNLGDPFEAEAYYQCLPYTQSFCVGLPGDPNG